MTPLSTRQLDGLAAYGELWLWLLGNERLLPAPGLELPARGSPGATGAPRDGIMLAVRGEFLKEDLTSDAPTLGNPTRATTRVVSGTVGVNYWRGALVRVSVNYILNIWSGTSETVKTLTAQGAVRARADASIRDVALIYSPHTHAIAAARRVVLRVFRTTRKKTVEGCRAFLDMVEAATDLEPRAERVKQIEHETDTITHAVVEALHKTFITPIDRDAIYRLITRMDDIMDYVEAAAERIELYEITTMTTDVRDLARCLVRSAEHVLGAVSASATSSSRNGILKLCIDINRLENEADAILRRALARLFKEEKDPIAVIKWKEIYENLEIGDRPL